MQFFENDFETEDPIARAMDSGFGSDEDDEKTDGSVYQNSLIDFAAGSKRGYVTNWHHEELAKALEAVYDGRIKRLLVMMPPRHGKSELVSRAFPAWCLGKNPDLKIMACSHTSELAEAMSRDVQNVMDGEFYRSVFETRLRSGIDSELRGRKKLKETDRLFEVANGGDGYYIGTGVGGSITGRGFNIAIIDDPVKDAAAAESPAQLKKTADWFFRTLGDRGEGDLTTEGDEGDEAIILCMTAWSEADLSGVVLRHAKATGEEWVVIRYPAIAEAPGAANNSIYQATPEWCKDPRKEGEPLWPAKRNLKKLEEIKLRSIRHWQSNWQQRPTPEEGGMFKKAFWRWYKSVDELPRFDQIAFSADTAFKDNPTSSRVVLGKWGIAGKRRYLLDMWYGHMGIIATEALFKREFSGENAPCTKLIEDKATGTSLIERLQTIYSGIVPINPKGGKTARAVAVLPIIEGGDVYLPDFLPCAHALVDECASFPYGEYDDMVDMLSQLLHHYHYNVIEWLAAFDVEGKRIAG